MQTAHIGASIVEFQPVARNRNHGLSGRRDDHALCISDQFSASVFQQGIKEGECAKIAEEAPLMRALQQFQTFAFRGAYFAHRAEFAISIGGADGFQRERGTLFTAFRALFQRIALRVYKAPLVSAILNGGFFAHSFAHGNEPGEARITGCELATSDEQPIYFLLHVVQHLHFHDCPFSKKV